jgi:hypothetical protein
LQLKSILYRRFGAVPHAEVLADSAKGMHAFDFPGKQKG